MTVRDLHQKSALLPPHAQVRVIVDGREYEPSEIRPARDEQTRREVLVIVVQTT